MKNITLMYGDIEVLELEPPFTLYRENLLPIKEEAHIFTASEEQIQRDMNIFGLDGRWTGTVTIIKFVFDQYIKQPHIQIDDPYLGSDEKLAIIINQKNDGYWIRGRD